MQDYNDIFNIPQSEPLREDQVPNSAGGYAWQITPEQQLDRFLILGTLAGTFYAGARELTRDNMYIIQKLIDTDGEAVIKRVVEISFSGRAASNDPALFVLAMCASADSMLTRTLALKALPDVARIGTHLFTFLEYVKSMRGWGRSLRRAIADWYLEKDNDRMAYQMVKYRQRNGWTHADAIRLSHPNTNDSVKNSLFAWATGNDVHRYSFGEIDSITGFLKAQEADDIQEIIRLIGHYNLTREMIPNQHLKNAAVWEALLANMPATALIRNLGNMSKVGLLVDGAWDVSTTVTQKLLDTEWLKRSRVHPVALYNALKTYALGHGVRGRGEWIPVTDVIEALEEAFYRSFDFVEPTNKRHMLALDVSGSMTWQDPAGLVNTDCREAAALMAMVTYRTEPQVLVTAFSHELVDIRLRRDMTLQTVTETIDRIAMGGTDCALPMIHALNNGLEIDQFVVYTDSETRHGQIHPEQALDMYRQQTGIPAKLVVVGMTSSNISIADPLDAGMLDVVGFDTNTPKAIAEFTNL